MYYSYRKRWQVLTQVKEKESENKTRRKREKGEKK